MKRHIVEAIGTFFLTLAIGLTGNEIAIAAMFVAIIYMGFPVSGGHYNPSFCIADWLRGRMSVDLVWSYILAQVIGAFCASFMLFAITQSEFMPMLVADTPWWVVACFEALFSFLLVMVFLTVNGVYKTKDAQLFGFILGAALLAIVYMGGLFNPAVALGTGIFSLLRMQSFELLMALLGYIVGPIVGAFLAAHAYGYLYSGMASTGRSRSS